MKMNRTTILAAAVLSLGLWGLSLQAAEKPAKSNTAVSSKAEKVIGDAAPAIPSMDIEVVSGTLPDRGFKAGTVYVVEFWATWCQFSLQAIPSLNKVQKDFDGKVVVIGVSDEPSERIRDAMGRLKVPAEYALLSDPRRQMGLSYMTSFRERQKPVAFIVDKHGKVAWIGSPLAMDAKLKELVAAP